MSDPNPLPQSSSYYLDLMNEKEDKYKPKDWPRVSVIIPTSNVAMLISTTLESVLIQKYSNFEVIIVDCSTDRTLEIIRNYQDDRIRIYSVGENNRYEMLNKGLSQALGSYVNILFPGDFYLYPETLKLMMHLALDHDSPQLVYCGTLLRDAIKEVKILFRPLNIDLLKRGQQPTSLQSCWFRIDALRKIGKFNTRYEIRGGFDLLCRFCLQPDFTFASTSRVLTDYDLRAVTRQMVATHFKETFQAIYCYFGLKTAVRWLLIQKDWLRYLSLLKRSLKIAFIGR